MLFGKNFFGERRKTLVTTPAPSHRASAAPEPLAIFSTATQNRFTCMARSLGVDGNPARSRNIIDERPDPASAPTRESPDTPIPRMRTAGATHQDLSPEPKVTPSKFR